MAGARVEPVVPDALRDSSIRTDFVQANGLDFEVDMSGPDDARVLALCLHGFPEHAFSWRFQLPMLGERGYKTWAPNLRGYGRTTRPIGVGNYAIECLLDDVAGLIDASNTDETVLIAHDWGAVIAWWFAIRAIRPLKKLIICNVPHPQAMRQQGGMSWAQLKKSWYVFFFQIPGLPEYIFGKRGGESLANIMAQSAVDKTNFPPEVGNVFRANAMQPGALTAMINYYRAYVSGGGVKRQQKLGMPRIETPTLMLWGEEDVALTKETTFGTDLFVQDLTLRYLPQVSHWVQQEQPEAVNAMMAAFLADAPVPEFRWHWTLAAPAERNDAKGGA